MYVCVVYTLKHVVRVWAQGQHVKRANTRRSAYI